MINDSFFSSLQGGIPFSVTFNPSLDAHITSVYAVFVKSDIVLGNVEMVILPDCLLGRKIPGLLTFNQISHNVSDNSYYCFFRGLGHGNESCNLIGSLPGQYFPISAHGPR